MPFHNARYCPLFRTMKEAEQLEIFRNYENKHIYNCFTSAKAMKSIQTPIGGQFQP